ncbi:3-hydroxyacyl-CoA dehydrogenase NAD-binding domain-containing protein [Georgenia muralis]|uniref:3-hydroxyacyl-CoA dehydrogenase n=1 Tax=Georgenia muralis TaxID=154117 RepID=A0A3N5AAI4_9MICO|nr:3-hydroxyacyl-CoA dehydrogenase NAD-binding domain-containing protein [Georgenia muralis]RPF28631.1 3-hydroxyacyl-CoA dehydrogenase [Georgenia muralis]
MPAPSYTERVTVVRPSDVEVPGLGTAALLVLVAEDGSDRPCSLGPTGLANLEAAVAEAGSRAARGEVGAVVLTGGGRTFLAGADLTMMRAATTADEVRALAEAGHRLVAAIADLPVPTLAHLNGAALGGGLEIALACDHRTAAPGVRAIGLPEVTLGLLPGWGGCTVLPRLVGPDAALTVILDNPARANTLLDAAGAQRLGVVDVVVGSLEAALEHLGATVTAGRAGGPATAEQAGGPAGAESIAPAGGAVPVPADEAAWSAAVGARRERARAAAAGGAPAAARALGIVEASRTRTRAESFAAEDDGLTELVMTDQCRASLYAADLLGHRTARPGRPEGVEPRPVTSVGIAGAGLMAGQLALLLARSLRVPVTMRDLDDERAARGLAAVRAEIGRMRERGRLDEATAEELTGLVTVTTDLTDLAGADLVVEAVFEELEVKRAVLSELEGVVSPTAVLATNTSALSVTAMAEHLRHPERVVGLHFFNPVAQMPLVEVVRARRTDDPTYATAFAVADRCRKTSVAVADAPGFVVNRLLVRLLGEVLGSLEEGTTVAEADAALVPMGLPMGPFQLLQLVGPAVAEHVLITLREQLGERYPDSPGLRAVVASGRAFVTGGGRPTAASPVDPAVEELFGSRRSPEPLDAAGVLRRVQLALAEETHLLLREGVVSGAEDVDLAMILGAGWPAHNGGLTPYLDRTGAAEERGGRFHPRGVADLP